VTANADEGSILQDLKELGLDAEIETADFVKEERAEVRLFDAAEFCCDCASEGSAFVTEEFGFEERIWDGGTTDFDERTTGPQGKGVKKADTKFLARAAFALDKYWNVGLCDAFELRPDCLHGGCFAEDDLQRRHVQKCGSFRIVNQGHFFPVN
jgi:hypothetical protein